MNTYKLFFLLVVLSTNHYAQDLEITGKVMDKEGQPIFIADVILKTLAKEVQAYGITDSLGEFKVKTSPGTYLLEVHHLAYQNYRDTIKVTNSSYKTFSVELSAKQENLSEVILITKKPLLEKKLDRIVINVDNQLASTGSTTFELLKHTPGIYTTANDELQMLGKSGVRLLLNGRLQYVSGEELNELLKSINADDIVKIELITTPPSKYEAEGNAGYINIITKKLKKDAWKVRTALNLNQGKYARMRGNAGLQYQTSRLSADITYNGGKIHSFENIEQYNLFGLQNNQEYYRSYNQEIRHTLYNSIRSQVDWQLDEKSSLSFATRTLIQQSNRPAQNHTLQLTQDEKILQEINTSAIEEQSYLNYSNDVYYEHKLDSLGKKMTLNGSLAGFDLSHQQEFSNSFYIPTQGTSQEQLRSDFDNSTTIKAMKLDFYLPYLNSTWETGIKYAHTKANNTFIFENFDAFNWELNPNVSNNFIYREQNAAMYISFETAIAEKWKLKAGLRAEYTTTEGNSPTLNQLNTYDYFQLFPTFYLQYKVNDYYLMNISYSRRINRPDYSSLNPFITYQSPLFSNQGNPLLRPEFTHSIEWNHTLNNRYIITPFYNYTAAYYSEFPFQINNSRETRYTFGNLGSFQNVGLQVILPFQITKSIDWQHNLLGLYQYYHLSYNSVAVKPQGFFWRYQTSFSMELMTHLNAEFSAYYESKSLQAFYQSDDTADFSMGVTYSFWKEKARLSFNISDMLYTNRAKVKIEYPNQTLGFYRRNDTRLFRLGFSYQFGQQTTKDKKTFGSASEEEQSRG